MKNHKGFTLIELMTVISIIGILAAIAIPQFSAYRLRAYKCEGYALSEPVRKNIIEFLEHTGQFPKDNAQCGIAKPDYIKGKYVDSITVKDGVINILYNDFKEDLKGQYLKFIPELNKEDPTGTVIWNIEHGQLPEKV